VCRGLERIGVGDVYEYECEYKYASIRIRITIVTTNNKIDHEHKDHLDLVVPVQALRNAIPFQKDVIVIRTGSSVAEHRGAVWVAD
jgi:hypothetical protein